MGMLFFIFCPMPISFARTLQGMPRNKAKNESIKNDYEKILRSFGDSIVRRNGLGSGTRPETQFRRVRHEQVLG